MRRVGFVLALLVGASSIVRVAGAEAQAPPPGTRIRLTVPCGPRATCRPVGSLLVARADSVTLALPDSTVTHAVDAIRRFEVSRGRRSHWLAGAGIGLAASGVAIVVLHTGGSTSPCDRSANQDALSPGECLGLSVLGAVAFTGVGAALGSLVRTERWQELPLERLRLGLVPRPGGAIALSATVVF